MTLSEYLTRLRNDSGLTYQHIAEQTGLHINTVQNIINGKTRSTSIDKAQRLVIALGGSLDALKQLDYEDGDPMVSELALIPSDTQALAAYADRTEIRMQYSAALMRERQINRLLIIVLIIVLFLLLLLTSAVIALFTYDLSQWDRGWFTHT